MEAATVPTPTEAPEPPEAEAGKAPGHMFQWYTWLHVGAGAQECEHATTGKCPLEGDATPVEERHFHAWCRMPNQFQMRDIAEKARAAKARKMRAMRNPDTDQYAILENELDQLRDNPEEAVEEILNGEWLDDYNAALRIVEEREEFSLVDQDREEFQRQQMLAPEDREEGFDQLAAHMDEYGKAADAELEKIQEPKRQSLRQLPIEDLVTRVRRGRVENIGNEEYLHTYNYWSWFAGTLKVKNGGPSPERRFADITILKQQTAPEVIEALKETYNELENRLARGRAAKNS